MSVVFPDYPDWHRLQQQGAAPSIASQTLNPNPTDQTAWIYVGAFPAVAILISPNDVGAWHDTFVTFAADSAGTNPLIQETGHATLLSSGFDIYPVCGNYMQVQCTQISAVPGASVVVKVIPILPGVRPSDVARTVLFRGLNQNINNGATFNTQVFNMPKTEALLTIDSAASAWKALIMTQRNNADRTQVALARSSTSAATGTVTVALPREPVLIRITNNDAAPQNFNYALIATP